MMDDLGLGRTRVGSTEGSEVKNPGDEVGSLGEDDSRVVIIIL